MKKPKVCLGDGLYAEDDGFGGIWLTSEDGINILNKVYLEPFVYEALKEYVEAK